VKTVEQDKSGRVQRGKSGGSKHTIVERICGKGEFRVWNKKNENGENGDN